MLPIDLFRRPMFALSAATSVCSFAVQGLAFVSLPFYFEDVLHRSQVETGFFMTPWPLVVAIMAPIGGRLSDRYPVGILGGVGLVLLGIGMALLATLPPDPGTPTSSGAWWFADRIWLLSNAQFAGDHVERAADRGGSASGIVATARLTGQTRGRAGGTVLCLVGHEGATLALALGAGFAALGSLMSFLRLAVGAPRP